MKTTKYTRLTDSYFKSKKNYENMFEMLQKDIRGNCGLKVKAICERLEITEAMYRYYFRTKKWPEKLLKKLLKIIDEN